MRTSVLELDPVFDAALRGAREGRASRASSRADRVLVAHASRVLSAAGAAPAGVNAAFTVRYGRALPLVSRSMECPHALREGALLLARSERPRTGNRIASRPLRGSLRSPNARSHSHVRGTRGGGRQCCDRSTAGSRSLPSRLAALVQSVSDRAD